MSSPPPAPAPSIPDYELLRAIGRGSYGEVWLARSVTGVFRVIKIVRRDRCDDERPYLRELEGITRFQTAASGRPRQLALLHVGRNDQAGYFYYVMEPADDVETGSEIIPDKYIPLTLKELFSRRGRLPAAECIHLALELARGLAVLHAANLIHRDIKPSNIIFVQRVPKLADVGLVASSEATMTCAGTPGYAPREGAGTVAADIFSLGKVLYEITTGLDRMEFPRLPVELADATDSAIFRELNSIILRACHPDPEERQPSADALARDLELVQAGRSVAFYEALRRRTRAIAISAAVLTLLAGLGTTLLYWRSSILQRANQRARHALYRSDLAVAQLARASGDLGRARAALARQIPQPGETDLRGIEWAILQHSVRGEGTPLEPATNGVAVTSLAVDPTGRWLAASFADQSAALWNLHSGKIERRLGRLSAMPGTLSSGEIVGSDPSGGIRIIDPKTGSSIIIPCTNELSRIIHDDIIWQNVHTSKCSGAEFSLRTQSFLSVHNLEKFTTDHAVLWTVPSYQGTHCLLGLLREDGLRRERVITSIDLSSGKELWRKEVAGRILWIRASPDNTTAVANIGGLMPVLLHFISPTNQTRLIGHTARVQEACFSNDGKFIATASADQTIRVWDAQTGEQLAIMRGLGRPATCVAWNNTSSSIVAGDDSGSIRVFQHPSRTTPDTLTGFFDDIHGDIVFDQSGKNLAATVSTNAIAIVSTDKLTISKVISNVFQPITFTKGRDELLAFSDDFELKSVNLETGFASAVTRPLPADFSLLAWEISPTRELLAMSGSKGQVAVINLVENRVVNLEAVGTNAAWALTFSDNGEELWTGSANGMIEKWNPFSGKNQGDQIRVSGDIQTIAVSSDGQWVAVGMFDDASIRVWDRKERTWIKSVTAHRRFPSWMRFSDNNQRLISAGADGRLIVWRVPEFDELSVFTVDPPLKPTGDEGIAVVRISASGGIIAALTEDGRLKAFRAEPSTSKNGW